MAAESGADDLDLSVFEHQFELVRPERSELQARRERALGSGANQISFIDGNRAKNMSTWDAG